MNEPNYSHLDDALMKHIQQGHGSLFHIFVKGKHLTALAEPCRTEDAWSGRSSARHIIESRLQALKEIDLIAWDGTRWRLV